MPMTMGTGPAIKRESILVRADAELPDFLQIAREPFLPRWGCVRRFRPAELERELGKVDWHFFFIPPEIQAFGLARVPDRALHKAITRLLGRAEVEKLNALEITNITTKTYLGFHLASVRAHLRHIQDSPFLFKAKVRVGQPAIRMAA